MLVLLALLAGPGGELLEARLEAHVGLAHADVRLAYRVVFPAQTEELSFSALAIGGASIAGLTAAVDGESTEVELDSSREHVLSGRIALPRTRDEELLLRLRYDVTGPRAVLPILLLDVGPGVPRGDLFVARVTTEKGVRFDPRFPSNAAFHEGGYTWKLPIVPSFVSLEAPQPLRPRTSAVAEAGVSFWGLFATFGVVVLLYAVWMARAGP